jgi:hypothetical protein
LRHLFDRCCVKEVCVVFETPVQFFARFGHHEREIKLCNAPLERQGFQLKSTKIHSRACLTQREQRQPFVTRQVGLVHREHDLKERRA